VTLDGNAERFTGFADLYDAVRPTPPQELGSLLCEYAGVTDADVVDLGSGSGLSSRWCATWAAHVTGVEPSADMRELAARTGSTATIAYRDGWGHATGIADSSADIVVAVQSLHWMEPTATLDEVARVLRSGGAFAAIDCDWPPAIGDALVEREWLRARELCKHGEQLLSRGLTGDALRKALAGVDTDTLRVDADTHLDREPSPSVRVWAKEQHLERMRASGHFAWCRELAVHRREPGDAARFVDLLRSQGDLQTMLKHGATEDDLGIARLADLATRRLGTGPRPLWFTYRVRLGVTPDREDRLGLLRLRPDEQVLEGHVLVDRGVLRLAEDALPDDVLLDLGGAAGDAEHRREEER
jgi:SAM-dependent methyltransferase